MNSTITTIKNKFEELKLSFMDENEIDPNENLINWWLQDADGANLTDIEKEFKQFAEEKFEFKQIKHYSGPDYDDWSQGLEIEAFSIIQLEGVYYKLTYNISSYGWISCVDFWDWKEATKVEKAVTFYE